MTDDLKLNPAKAYFRPKGTEEWIDLGPVSRPEPTDGPVEVRRRIPVTKIISRSGRDITDEFDLEHGITMTVAFPTLEKARKWCSKEDT
jgi:hypothetical protein